MKFSKIKEAIFVKNIVETYNEYDELKCENCIFFTDGYCNNPESNYCGREVPPDAFCHWWDDGSLK